MEVELARRTELGPEDPLPDYAARLSALTEKYIQPDTSLRDSLREDSVAANKLGVDIINWYQESSTGSHGPSDELIAASQTRLQPVILDLIPVVGREMQLSLFLMYPTIDSVAVKQGYVDAAPTIALLDDPEVPLLHKDRAFKDWSWYIARAPIKPSSPEDEAVPLDPFAEFQLQTKQWFDDFIRKWDGTNIHIDPRMLTSVAPQIDDEELRYQFVYAHVMYKPADSDYPPAFEITNIEDDTLVAWLDRKFRSRNIGVNIITGQPIKEKTPAQINYEARLKELDQAYSRRLKQRQRR